MGSKNILNCHLMFLQIAAANKTVIPAVSAIKFPALAVTFSNGKIMTLPVTPNSNEVSTEDLAVPKVSLVCLSFRASSQVQKLLTRFVIYVNESENVLLASTKQ